MRSLLVRYGIPFLFGLFGLFGGLLVVHAYVDHQALHAIITYINAQEAAKNAAPKQPALPPAVQ